MLLPSKAVGYYSLRDTLNHIYQQGKVKYQGQPAQTTGHGQYEGRWHTIGEVGARNGASKTGTVQPAPIP